MNLEGVYDIARVGLLSYALRSLAAFAAGCTSLPPGAQCSGDTIACTCPGGGMGTATCRDGRYAPCVCVSGCTPVTCTARWPPFRPGTYEHTEVCGTSQDGCGGTLNCGTCPTPRYRALPNPPFGVTREMLYFSPVTGAIRGARFQHSIFGMDLGSGVILQELERSEGVASALDPTGRYLHYVGPENTLQALDTATGSVRMRSALPMEPQTRRVARVLLEVPGGSDRWIFSGQVVRPIGGFSGLATWVVDSGQVALELPDFGMNTLVRLDNGIVLGLGSDGSREAMLGRQNNEGIWVFSSNAAARPTLVAASARRLGSGGLLTISCSGNLCFDSAGTRYDFSAGPAATAERIFSSIGVAEGALQATVAGVHADVPSDELWYAIWRGINVVTLHRFRLSAARAATPLRFDGAPVMTTPLNTQNPALFQRVGPDAMVLEYILIRDPRLAAAR